MISVALIHGSQRSAWGYVPIVEGRVRAFCKEYASDMDADYLVQFLRMSFVSSGPTSLVLAALDPDGVVVGHCIAIAEEWFGKRVVTLVQLEVDRGTILTKEEWATAENAFLAFAHYHKAENITVAARNPAAARLFTRRGFQGERILMKRPVPVEGRTTPVT